MSANDCTFREFPPRFLELAILVWAIGVRVGVRVGVIFSLGFLVGSGGDDKRIKIPAFKRSTLSFEGGGLGTSLGLRVEGLSYPRSG